MFNFKWKKIGVIAGLSLSLIAAGCGSDDGEAQSETSASEEMEYTITGIEPGAGQTETNEIAISEYDSLAGWQQELSSTGAMLSELSDAMDNEEPIVISAWSPHYMFANWDIKYLEDPKGIFGEEESITTIAREGLKEDMPGAHTMLDRFQWELEDVEYGLLEAQEKSFEEVAQEWVEENQDTVAEWTEGVEPVDGTPIELVLTPWDAETFTTNIAKVILEQQGYSVTLTPIDPAVLFEAIADGSADASLAPWMPATHGELYAQYEGQFEDLGPNVDGAKIGLAVPEYMDVDSIEDLQPKE
ncbi:glycine betaine ABC transporter substrate-binding protein [Virgibacillus xinjiangensis]|uniref:Glycine betaine ABC transporter substrate-binding protein n=1 Tax=Virgibacillus xinjiangensis TaxID=393090 RepID=A0ABV7CS33_9BACI